MTRIGRHEALTEIEAEAGMKLIALAIVLAAVISGSIALYINHQNHRHHSCSGLGCGYVIGR
jgi:hypothetical protein